MGLTSVVRGGARTIGLHYSLASRQDKHLDARFALKSMVRSSGDMTTILGDVVTVTTPFVAW